MHSTGLWSVCWGLDTSPLSCLSSGSSFISGQCGQEIPPCQFWEAAQEVETLSADVELEIWTDQSCLAWLVGFFSALGHHLLLQHLTEHKSLTLHLCRHLCITTYLYHHWCCNLRAVILYTPRDSGGTGAWMWTQSCKFCLRFLWAAAHFNVLFTPVPVKGVKLWEFLCWRIARWE